MIKSLKASLYGLSEVASKDYSKLLSDASKRIAAKVKSNDHQQRTMEQDSSELQRMLYEGRRRHVEDEREKRKVK